VTTTTDPAPSGATPGPTVGVDEPHRLRDWLLGRLDGVSLAISLVGLMTIAASAVLLVRVAGPIDWLGLSGVILALLLLSAAALIGHFVVVALARQRYHERLAAMREAAKLLGHGDLSVAAPIAGDDLGSVGHSLNQLATRMGRMMQAQRDLLSGVSHELRSPIARIDVALELLSMEGVDEAEKAELIGGIREETALLERHISRLLEAQRVSTKRVLLKRRPLVLDKLVAKVIDRERLRLSKLGWQVETQLEMGDREVLGDDNALDRVLSTLVENAIRHASKPEGDDEPSQLRIETQATKLGAVIRVMDRGPGLTDEQCASVFEPFFRIDKSRSTKTGGTGLGMFLARQICEAHRGHARAQPRPGGGLSVVLTLPIRGQKELKETLRVEMDAEQLDRLVAEA